MRTTRNEDGKDATEQMPRVLLSAFACDPITGSEPYVGWNWATRLDRKYDLYVLTRSYSRDLIRENAPDSSLRIIAFDLPFCRSRNHYWKLIKPYYILWQFAAWFVILWHHLRTRFDVIHHLTYNVVDMPGFLAFVPGARFIWGPVGGGQVPPESLKQVYGAGWRRQRVRALAKRFARLNPLVVLSARLADHVFFANAETSALLAHHCRNSSIMLETAIDPAPLDMRPTDGPLQLLWTGNVIDRKALIIAVDALGLLKHDRPGLEVRMTVVGDGPLLQSAKDRAEFLGIAANVEFLGRVPFSRVLEITGQSDAFLFTSVQDTSGNVVLEAMSRGKPVITLDHQGAAEIVTEDSGVKVPVGEYEEVVSGFANSIADFATDRGKAERAGRNAYRVILDHHSWASRVERYEQVISQITQNGERIGADDRKALESP